MKKFVVFFAFLIVLSSSALAQTFLPYSAPIRFTQDQVEHVWDHYDQDPAIAIFLDGGTPTCNYKTIVSKNDAMKADARHVQALSSYLKAVRNKYHLEFQDAGKFGNENLLFVSACGIEKLDKSTMAANSWMIFKLSERSGSKCFEESQGISLDQATPHSVFAIIYTYAEYHSDTQKTTYGRSLPYDLCDQ